jgi:hypothetical protein
VCGARPPVPLLFVLALAGCNVLFPYSKGKQDQRPPTDLGTEGKDRPSDVRPVDGGLERQPRTDLSPPDRNKATERVVDMKKPDTKPGDVLPTPTCADYQVGNNPPQLLAKVVANKSKTAFMIACQYPSTGTPVPQCQAVKACRGSWKPCTVDQYAAALDQVRKTPVGMEWSWLGACALQGGNVPSKPTTSACSTCTGTTALDPFMWDCANFAFPSVPTNSGPANVGLMSYVGMWCWTLGTDTGAWAPCAADGKSPCTSGAPDGGVDRKPDEPRRVLCCYP